jgi:membrane associated rhomboid family serine protease
VTYLLILVLVVVGVAYYFMTADERTRALGALKTGLRDGMDAITFQGLACDSFFDFLRARTRRLTATPFLVVLSGVITLAGMGGTNDKPWHLVMVIFGHSRVLELVVGTVCLFQLGFILERLLGRLAFITIYVATGAAAGIISLALFPDGVNIGASASVLGLYGVLAVTSIWSLIYPSVVSIPLVVAKRLAPVAAVFVVYHWMTSDFGNAAYIAAFAGGLIGGILVARDVNYNTPPIRPLATAMGVGVAIVTVCAVIVMHRPVNAVTDVRPEIQRVIAVEHRTAGLYNDAIATFRKGRIDREELVDLIQETIVPELHTLSARLNALHDVRPEDRPLVATVEEFLKLRDESWRLRAAALLNGDISALRRADSKEQASLEALNRIKTRIG